MIGLIFTHNIYEAYVYFFLDGISFAGKVIVCLTYVIEFLPFEYHEYGPLLLNGALGPFTILCTLWYQFVDNSWFWLQILMLILQVLATCYILFFVPESPKWLYTWKDFGKARENLGYVARYNAATQEAKDEITNGRFIDEDEADKS
jgi:MFS family permease